MKEEQLNIRLGEKVLKNLNAIQKNMEFGTRAQAITFSVRFAKKFIEIEKDGGTIFVEFKDKTRGRLIIL